MFAIIFSAIITIISVVLLSIFIKDLVDFIKAKNNYDIEDHNTQLWEHVSISVIMGIVVILMFVIHLKTY